ncbi:hypothetical protein DNTS_012493, partial [Danionella cerebrum]
RKSPPPGVAETSMASREAVVRALESGGGVLFRMVEPDERPSGTGQRLGAPESMGISTLEPGQRPPTMPPGRQVSIRVQMLDDTLEVFQVSHRAPGKVLFDLVCSHLNLIEGDYFGLEFQDQRKMTVWLDLLKPILKQIRRPKNSILRMVVKFFPPDHTLLLEELTRYLFALQIKHDLACGRLTCNESSAALLVSHIVQSEIGDFDEVQCKQHLLNNKYIPEQDTLMDKVMEYHRKHVGQTPAESDYQLLEIARRLEMYGVRLHPAKDREGTKLSLAVAHSGVLVFQGHTKINAFNWSKVRKLSFKRKRFLIKLRPDLNQSNCQDTLEFMMGSRDCCKVFWKICVEYHAFFRLFEEPKPKPKPVLFTRGSSFRFSGRTQRQVIDYVKDSEFKKVPFERKHSKIQFNSLSPFPSRLSAEGQGEKNASASGPQAESPIGRTQVTVENPALQRYTGSLTYQTNGCRNGNHDEMDTRLKPSPSKQQPEHLSTGLALHSAKGSSSSIPYIDCSDIDSEYDVVSGRITRVYSHTHDSDEAEPKGHRMAKSNGFGNTNGHEASKSRFRESPVTTRRLAQSSDSFNSSQLSNGSFCGNGSPRALPLSSTLVDELFQGMDRRGLVSNSSQAAVSRSANGSPVMGSFHRTDQIPNTNRRRWEDGSHYLNNNRSLSEAQHYGSYSPIVSRSPHLQKLHNGMRNRSDTDPMILSQFSSTPCNERLAMLSRSERMAALERRGGANGPGARSGNVPRLYGSRLSANDHSSPVHMIDGSTSSGTESSDTESDAGSNSYSQPIVFGNPGAASSSPVTQNKFSFGGFQVEDEELIGKNGCAYPISNEGGAQFFNYHSRAGLGPVNRSPLHSEVMVNGQKQTLSPDGPQPSPLTSPLLNDAGFIRMDDEDEVRRKRFPTDKAYFITKELLTTERTYLKDLEVITVSFQNSVGQDEVMSDSLKKLIFANFEPVYKFHESFLKDVEQREGRSNAHIKGDYQCIGDIMLKNIQGLKLLSSPLRLLSEALLELERSVQLSRRLESLCKDFQQQKVCYLPLNVFFLRPLHRLLHYKLMLERLCKHYPPTHQDFRDSRAALADISEMVLQLNDTLMKMENFQKLLELKKDLVGVESLIAPAREFIRLGCLSKLSGKGLQQRMFFLIRESEDEWGVPHSFTLSGQRQSVVVAASSASEMEKWLEDIRMAVELADQCNGPSAEILSNSFTEHKSPEECVSEHDSEDDLSSSRSSLERQTPQRGNTSVTHVCWHRNTSVSMLDFNLALENQLSGNLLRKFKNSNGWQKLWVVFTNFSLFFYKTHQDEYPLASLPLLGYSITVPSEAEQIQKDYVFKLHFKSHVYYFRSESEYTFERWMEVIRSATCSYSHSRPSSRKELLVY